METVLIIVLSIGIGWFVKPVPVVVPPPATAITRCADLTPPRGRTLADVQRSAVEAAVAYREVCTNHDELIDWADRAVNR